MRPSARPSRPLGAVVLAAACVRAPEHLQPKLASTREAERLVRHVPSLEHVRE